MQSSNSTTTLDLCYKMFLLGEVSKRARQYIKALLENNSHLAASYEQYNGEPVLDVKERLEDEIDVLRNNLGLKQ